MTAARSAVADPDHAAAALTAARRVLVTGLVAAEADVAAAACDLAEAGAAVVDPGSPETARAIGPLVARIGAVTAAAGELRDRADLVVLWFCGSPDATGLTAACPPATASGAARRTIAVGPSGATTAGVEHVPVNVDAAVDLARLVEALVRGVAVDEAAADAGLRAAARDVAAAIAAAGTVAFVTDWRHDAVGLAAWSTAAVVRAVAHVKPAFELPLGERADDAVSVCTWRYGAAGAIERANRAGGRFLPAEADAVRLIDRGETDCVVVIGGLTAAVAEAVARAGAGLAVIRLPADAATIRRVVDRIRESGGPRP